MGLPCPMLLRISTGLCLSGCMDLCSGGLAHARAGTAQPKDTCSTHSSCMGRMWKWDATVLVLRLSRFRHLATVLDSGSCPTIEVREKVGISQGVILALQAGNAWGGKAMVSPLLVPAGQDSR
eukprot:5490591-Amphidinium_carterae.1